MTPAPPGLRNPFPGLRPFETEEADLFFGREDETYELLSRLRRTHFLAVLGDSGCGKSSLVRAGLLAALHGGFMVDTGASWRIAILRPADTPITHLARALADPQALGPAESAAETEAIFLATLRRGARGLVEAAREAPLPEASKLLVLVDQFEELFRFMHSPDLKGASDEARAFVRLLLEASAQRNLPIYVVLTMRSEYLGHCAALPGLAEAITDGIYLVPRMTRDQLRETIEGPIALCGGRITNRLVNRLLNDLEDNPDQLPILQHALMRLWCVAAPLTLPSPSAGGEGGVRGDDDRRPIDLVDYARIGTLSNALSQHANETLDGLGEERLRRVAEVVFRNLIDTRDDNVAVRRAVKLGRLGEVANAPLADVAAVVEAFRAEGRSFLMPPRPTQLTSETLIDISHESLIRQWDKLKRWAEEEAIGAMVRGGLRHSARLWDKYGGDESYLYHGVSLTEAEKWAATHAADLTAMERAFLEASRNREQYRRDQGIREGQSIPHLIVLRALSYFAKPVPRNALEAVLEFAAARPAEDLPRLLGDLQRVRLVERDTAERCAVAAHRRAWLEWCWAQRAREAPAGEDLTECDRRLAIAFVRHYMMLLRGLQLPDSDTRGDTRTKYDWVEEEWPNVRSAFVALCRLAGVDGSSVVEEHARALIAVPCDPAVGADHLSASVVEEHARALIALATELRLFCQWRGHNRDWIEMCRAWYRAAVSLGDAGEQAWSSIHLLGDALDRQDAAEARTWADRALAALAQSGGSRGRPVEDYVRGAAAQAARDWDRASRFYERALAVSLASSHLHDTVVLLERLAKCAHQQGLYDLCRTYWETTEAAAREGDFQGSQLEAQLGLGEVLLAQAEGDRTDGSGSLYDALDSFELVARRAEELKSPPYLCFAHYGLARVHEKLGDVVKALSYAADADGLKTEHQIDYPEWDDSLLPRLQAAVREQGPRKVAPPPPEADLSQETITSREGLLQGLRQVLQPQEIARPRLPAPRDRFARPEVECRVLDWVTSQEPAPLVIVGTPGSGKSTLAAAALADTPTLFFDAHQAAWSGGDPLAFFAKTVAYRRAERSVEFAGLVAQALKELPPAPSADVLFEALLLRPLQMAPPRDPVVLVADGIEQLPAAASDTLLGWLQQLHRCAPAALRLLVTTRSGGPVLRSLAPHLRPVCVDLSGPHEAAAVRKYLAVRLRALVGEDVSGGLLDRVCTDGGDSLRYVHEFCDWVGLEGLTRDALEALPASEYPPSGGGVSLQERLARFESERRRLLGLKQRYADDSYWRRDQNISDDEVLHRLEECKRALDWDNTTGSARKWWQAFENENRRRMRLVLRLARELEHRRSTITEFFLSYVYSNTDNIQANLHFLDYLRHKKSAEARRKALAAEGRPSGEEEFTFGDANDEPVPAVQAAGPEPQPATALVRARAIAPPTTLLYLLLHLRREVEALPATLPAAVPGVYEGLDDDDAWQRYLGLKPALRWSEATADARAWWEYLERQHRDRPKVLLRLAEALKNMKASAAECHLAYVQGNTADLQAVLDYLAYTRLKEEERKRKEAAPPPA